MLGLNRTDLNITGISYLHGFPVNLNTIEFGNLVDWSPSSSHFGNVVFLPLNLGNTVNWRVEPDVEFGNLHFGNYFGSKPVLVSFGFLLGEIVPQAGPGRIRLANGGLLLQG
jgi:hypothetical protein